MGNPLAVLLDQNVPRQVARWLSGLRPSWMVRHVADVGLEGKSDREIFEWAQERETIVVTFDEDFADQRSFPVGQHHGIIRLRVWPTTVEEIQSGLARLLADVQDQDLRGALVIIDRVRIRVRSGRPSGR